MEATSSYWKPVFYLLEAHGLAPWLVNARDVKHLPGRPKTDVLDAVWLCKVAERQMLRPSFVPPWPIRRLRDLTRYRTDLVAARTAEKNRIEKLLEDACIKLSVVASDIFGVSGRAMLGALVAGERDPKVLAQLARARMRGKIDRLEQAFDGHFADHHRFLLSRMLSRIEALDNDIAAVDVQIEMQLAPFAEAAGRAGMRDSLAVQRLSSGPAESIIGTLTSSPPLPPTPLPVMARCRRRRTHRQCRRPHRQWCRRCCLPGVSRRCR